MRTDLNIVPNFQLLLCMIFTYGIFLHLCLQFPLWFIFELELRVWILTSKNSAFSYKKIPGQVVICKAGQIFRLIYLETEKYS